MKNISIYGAGHLTRSMLKGLDKTFKAQISVYNRTEKKVDELKSLYKNIKKEEKLIDCINEKSFLFCIVPINALIEIDREVVNKIKETESIIVSCTNGVAIELLSKIFSGVKIIKLLPNINWQICEGVSLYSKNRYVTDEDIETFESILRPITEIYEVKNEDDFEKLGTLTTCAPGLFSILLDYVNKEFDIRRQDEQELFYKAIRGSLDYMILSKLELDMISKEVANKGGLTEVGINALNQKFPECIKYVNSEMSMKISKRKKQIELKIFS